MTARIPTEFQYFENVRKPINVWRLRLARVLFRQNPRLPDEVIRAWAESYYDADPVAERFVEDVYLRQGQAAGRAMVEKALAEGVQAVPDAPESLRALFAEFETAPSWLDWEKVDLGARVFRRYGPQLYSFLGAITLDAYQENSVTKPLAFTGAYTGESANRRFLETASFWRDVSAPGGMHAGGGGVRTAVRVRLMHVFVRKGLLRHPQWDLDAWGMPISQGDALLTLIAGSIAPGIGLKLMGYRATRAEIEAMLHFWRYVGHVMGVQPRWYPATVEEGLSLLFASFIKGPKKAGEDGRNLAHSYVQSFAPSPSDHGFTLMRKKLDYWMDLGMTWFYLPGDTYRNHQLPKPGVWGLLPVLQFPVVFGLETIRRHSRWADDWRDRLAQQASERWLSRHLGEQGVEYKAVERFTR